MKIILIVTVLFLFVGCNIKPKVIVENKKTLFNCDNCIEIYGLYIHKKSPKIFTIDVGRRGGLDDTLFSGTYCEVYDISKEDTTFLIEQSRKNGYLKLPIKGVQFPFLKNYLDDKDTGFYMNKHSGDEFFGFDRYLIINLSKKYFIWFQDR